jgi:hypothetical protein
VNNLLYVAPRIAPPPTVDQVIEALDIARCIVNLGWVKHTATAVDAEGQKCHCLVAAITAASRTTQIREAALLACKLALPGRFASHTLEQYNDASAIHAGDVAWLLTAGKGQAMKAVA